MSDRTELRRLRAKLRRVTKRSGLRDKVGMVAVVPTQKPGYHLARNRRQMLALMRDGEGWAKRTAVRVLREHGYSADCCVAEIDPLTTAEAAKWNERNADKANCVVLPVTGRDAR